MTGSDSPTFDPDHVSTITVDSYGTLVDTDAVEATSRRASTTPNPSRSCGARARSKNTDGLVQVVKHHETDEIVGVHMVAPVPSTYSWKRRLL